MLPCKPWHTQADVYVYCSVIQLGNELLFVINVKLCFIYPLLNTNREVIYKAHDATLPLQQSNKIIHIELFQTLVTKCSTNMRQNTQKQEFHNKE